MLFALNLVEMDRSYLRNKDIFLVQSPLNLSFLSSGFLISCSFSGLGQTIINQTGSKSRFSSAFAQRGFAQEKKEKKKERIYLAEYMRYTYLLTEKRARRKKREQL